jgi:hypothetical protein
MTDEERARLAGVALECLRPYGLTGPKAHDPNAAGRAKATREQIRDIGWIEAPRFAGCIRHAVYDGIVAPLASYGIEVDRAALALLFGPPDA